MNSIVSTSLRWLSGKRVIVALWATALAILLLSGFSRFAFDYNHALVYSFSGDYEGARRWLLKALKENNKLECHRLGYTEMLELANQHMKNGDLEWAEHRLVRAESMLTPGSGVLQSYWEHLYQLAIQTGYAEDDPLVRRIRRWLLANKAA